ncbi:MAG TPA: phage major tail tube protein [Xanthobacteraceae bacterium]|nr:phage major tail tube protein [Xanthobacteraceae bacterium]
MAGAGTVYMMTAANLFCGDHDPTKSKHLTLDELTLPALEENYSEHHPGGAPVGVEFSVGIKKFESSFKLKGEHPDLLTEFGLGSKVRNPFTAYGVVKDTRTGRQFESKAIIEARLGVIRPDAFKRGEHRGHDYALNEIMHLEYYFDGAEKLFWDFFTNTWRVNGLDQNADDNRLLRISG